MVDVVGHCHQRDRVSKSVPRPDPPLTISADSKVSEVRMKWGKIGGNKSMTMYFFVVMDEAVILCGVA